MRSAGIIFGSEFHYLDHLAPLCAENQIPLIVTDDVLYHQAIEYYPDLEVIFWDPSIAPENLVDSFDRVITSSPRPLFDQAFFFAQATRNKRIETIWSPHGNSDKGRSSAFMEGLSEETHLLTYGPRIETFLKEKGIKAPTTRVGNYRYRYYQKHKAFYDDLLSFEGKKVVLYAPTWQDQEKNSSFPFLWTSLSDVSNHFTLVIKLHPNLYVQYPDEIAELKKKKKKNVRWIEDFPPIYPLLSKASLLISDMSSIAYDFLTFNRPILSCHPNGLGQFIPREDYSKLWKICDDAMTKKWDFTDLYHDTFG